MEAGEGMVAVVRGLKDAGLAVTLVDAGRTYTLLPDTVLHPNVPPESCRVAAYQYASTPSRRDSGVQATDGRYASTYRNLRERSHPAVRTGGPRIRSTPTRHGGGSPPPVRRSTRQSRPDTGHGNFQIGGAGSGETYFQSTKCNSFRGGMYWPDRGSVFTPKPSIQRDSFTSSLRKYPQDRSSEIVERLISFTQAKNATSKVQRSNVSPTRLMDSDVSNQTISLDASYRTNSAKIHRQYEQDATVRPKSALNYRLEESPTRERSRRGPVDQGTLDSWRRSAFCKNNDVRFLRDMSRKVRAGLKSSPQQHNIQPEKLNAKEKHEPITTDKKIGVESNTNSVNMEIQAAVQMVSREIVTAPIAAPSQRTIAVPLTPSPSQAETKPKILSQCRSEKPIMIPETETSAIKSDKDAELQTAINNLKVNDNKLIQYKGSKSQDEIRRVQNEVLVIQDLHLGTCCTKFHQRSYSRLNRSNKFLIKYTRNRERMTERESKFYERRCSYVAEDSKEIKRFQSYARVFHAEVKPFRTSCENDVAEILEDWLDLIPLKQEEYSNRRFNKEYMFYDFFECLKHFASNPLESKRKHKLKSDILDRLVSVPIETKGNRRVVLNRLADILINKVKHIGCKKCSVSAESSKREINELLGTSTPTYNEGNIMPSTESELKIFISAELMFYLEKTRLNINRRRTKILEDDLLDYFIFHKQELQLGNEKHCKKSVSNILIDYGFSEYQATDFANILLTHLKESFIASTISPTKVKSETFIVLQNVQNTKRSQNYVVNQNKASVDSKTKENKDENLDNYTNELCKQIDDWLSSLKLPILDSVEDGFRKVIINDLAGDIIDRQKYLELNPSSKGSDEAELEHLRYQIFKWTSKLVGEDNFVTKDHAPELMRRINEIPKFLNSHNDDRSNSGHPLNILKVCKRPLLIENSISDFDIKNNRSTLKLTPKPLNTMDKSKDERYSLDASISHSSKLINVMTMTNTGTSTMRINGSENRKCNQNTKTPGCINFNKSCSMKSVEQLEAEYAKFVKDWVQRIPIKVFGPDHGALVERARVELQNSLWKIVSKLNGDPATYYNRFFYEDLLDDAIEDLLNCLPQSPEMKSIRNSLKTEFIEKTVHFNDHIKAHEDASFKNKLVKNVIMNLRQHGIIDNGHDETIKEREDYQIIKLVEEYLLYTRFKNDNKLISNVFKKNLTQEIGEFVTNLKNNHEKELSNIDTVSFKTEIMNALEKVPLPCERTLREEAEDIIMGIEVEQWYNDLPIIQNEDSNGKIHRKRELDTLAMKIKEFENNSIKGNSNIELRKEISKFLQKSPLKEGERVNINFMVDELINRVKNMRTQDLSQNTKTVIFQAPESYEDFDRNVPLASSYIETPKIDNRLAKSSNPNTQFDSYKSEVSSNTQSHNYFKEPSSYKTFGEALPSSSSYHETNEQWHTLRDSQVHTPKRDITTNTPHYSIPNTSHTYQDKYLNTEEKSLNQDYFRNSSYQRDFENNQTQTFNADQRKFSIIKNPKRIRTSGGILGVDQAAGPSGYRHGNTENLFGSHNTSANLNQMPTASIYTDDRRNGNLSSHRRENSSIINKRDDKNDLSINKFSKGCQSSRNGDENTVENMNRFENLKHFSVATNTDTDRIAKIGPQIDAKTPREDKPSSSQTNKRHPKMDSSEKEGVKRKISLSETDDEDDEYQCRCIERYWKCRRRPKCLSGDDYPPCVPLFFPYPCFL